MSNIAYLGLGIMGRGMAANLIKGGHTVNVWNRNPERVQPLMEQGARAAASPAEAVLGAELVMYCLSDDAAVEDL
ncbi:MAG: NAD(P)-binding domain-containing protein, partial [Caldilineaceae bacterium]